MRINSLIETSIGYGAENLINAIEDIVIGQKDIGNPFNLLVRTKSEIMPTSEEMSDIRRKLHFVLKDLCDIESIRFEKPDGKTVDVMVSVTFDIGWGLRR